MLGSWLEAEYSVPERLLRGQEEPKGPKDEGDVCIEDNERRAEEFLRLVDITIEQNASGNSSGHSSPGSSP